MNLLEYFYENVSDNLAEMLLIAPKMFEKMKQSFFTRSFFHRIQLLYLAAQLRIPQKMFYPKSIERKLLTLTPYKPSKLLGDSTENLPINQTN